MSIEIESDEVTWNCYGDCSKCDQEVNNKKDNWPCNKCEQWLCINCKELSICEDCKIIDTN
jgi:hypothetical protein